MSEKALEGRELRSVQCRGEVTLPKKWREANGVDSESYVFVEEGDGGEIIIQPFD